MTSMRCPRCRDLLVHRMEPSPEMSRCRRETCGATFDTAGNPTVDTGPWPSRAELDDLNGLGGSLTGLDPKTGSPASWTWQSGTAHMVG